MTTRDSTRSELTLVRVVPAPWLHRVGLAVHPQTCPPGRSFRVSLGVIQPQLRQEPGAPAVQGLGRPSGRWRDEHFRWTAADWLGAEMGTRKAGGSNPSVGFSLGLGCVWVSFGCVWVWVSFWLRLLFAGLGCVCVCFGCVCVLFWLCLCSESSSASSSCRLGQAAWQRQWPQQWWSRRQPWWWVWTRCALQGLTAALDQDLAHTIALVTAQMADMTVILGNGDTLLELVTYVDTNTGRARSQ